MAKTIPVHGNLKVNGNISLENILVDNTGFYHNGVLIGQGGSGGSSLGKIFNTVSRYFVETATGQTVQVSSSASVIPNITWSRDGTTLTLNHVNHGRSVGDRVNIRNTNVDNQTSLITSITTDSYTIVCADTGSLSGTEGGYSCGFTFAHVGVAPSITGGILTAPANTDLQLLSMRIHLKSNTRAGATYILTLPPSAISSIGGSINNDTVYIPVQMLRQDADTLVAVGNTIATNIAGNYASFQFGALGAVTTGLLFGIQF